MWKVEHRSAVSSGVQHAASGSVPEIVPLDDFLERCEDYFADGGPMVEQPFQPRLEEGYSRLPEP